MLKPFIVLSLLPNLILFTSSLTRASEQIKKEDFVNLTVDNSNLLNRPTYIYELESIEELNGFSYGHKPDYVKFRLNEQIEVVDYNDNNLGDLFTFYSEYLEGKYIPCIEISNQNVAAKYEEYIDKYFIRDLAIYSSDISVFKSYYENSDLKKNYFVFDVSNYDLSSEENINNIISVSTIFDINIFAINSNVNGLKEIVRKFSSFNKCVWAINCLEDNIFSSITSNASGLVGRNFNLLEESLNKFNKNGLFSSQLLSAHRGAVNSEVNENSISSIQRAVDLGADYVEIDLQITKDHKIMLCHNDLLSPTTNCTSNLAFQRITYEETQKYYLTDNGVEKFEKIPTLDEVFALNKENNLKFILEFKFDQGFATGSWDVAKYVDEIVRNYDMENRVLGITFFKIYFESMSEHMPYMPKMYLGLEKLDTEYTSITDFQKTIKYFKKYKTGFDIAYSNTINGVAPNYLARGYQLNSWTFTDYSSLSSPLNIITSDICDDFVSLVKDIYVDDFYVINSYNEVSTLNNFKVTRYNGVEDNLGMELLVLDGDQDSPYLTCVAYMYDEEHEYGLYSSSFIVSNLENGGEKANQFEYVNGVEKFDVNIDNYEEKISNITYVNNNGDLISILLLSILLPICIIGLLIFAFYTIKKLSKIKK